MVSCWAHLGHAVQSPIRDPWTSSKWVKASIAHNTAAHNDSRSGPRSNKTTLAACKTMLSSLSDCALKKKIASSSSSLLQSLTRAWVFRCTAKALGARTAPRAQWDGERWYGLSRARAISHREILLLLQQSFLLLGVWLPARRIWQEVLGHWEKRCLLGVKGAPLTKSTGTWLLLNWRSRHLNPRERFRNSQN